MIRFVCDTPDRIPARIFRRALASSGGCPCCAFWRGTVVGIALGTCIALGARFIF